jgi:hypothetical protein
MTVPPSLFSSALSSDHPAYRNLCCSTTPEAEAGKKFAEQLWSEYYPYADANFLTEIRHDFHARFWEMYLTCALLAHREKKGYSLSCPKPKTGGPDILLDRTGLRIWIEAVTATDGDPGKPDSIVAATPGQGYEVPDAKIILRYTNAIAEKHNQYLRYRATGVVSDKDAYIVAVNGFPLFYRWADPEIPRVLKAVFPLGHLEMVFDRATTEVIETRHQRREAIPKTNQALVSTTMFLSEDYGGISAIIHSYANACMPCALGGDFLIAHNPLATCTIPLGLIPVVQEYVATTRLDGTIFLSVNGT